MHSTVRDATCCSHLQCYDSVTWLLFRIAPVCLLREPRAAVFRDEAVLPSLADIARGQPRGKMEAQSLEGRGGCISIKRIPQDASGTQQHESTYSSTSNSFPLIAYPLQSPRS